MGKGNYLMHSFPTTPSEMVDSLWRNRDLIKTSIKREVLGRYRGSMLGILWSFFNPMLMLLVYTFVFSVVFKARWNSGGDSKTEFALVLFAGLLIFNLFTDCISRAPNLILGNTNYVKKVVFPLEILPWIQLGSAIFHCLIGLSVWLLAHLVLRGVPHTTVLLFPLIVLPLVLFIMGASWILASLGVYLRDVGQFIGILVTVTLFLSPVFYPAAALPEPYRKLLYLNPLTSVIEQSRDVLYWGVPPDFLHLGGSITLMMLFAWLGFSWFQKTRKGFADVL